MNQASQRMLAMFSVAAGETDTPPVQATVTVRRRRGGCWCPWKVVFQKVAQFSFKDSRRDPIFGSVSSVRAPLVVGTLYNYFDKDLNDSSVNITLECLQNKQLVAEVLLQEFLYALLRHGSDGEIMFLVQNGKIVIKNLLSALECEYNAIYPRLVWLMISAGKSKHRKWNSDVSDVESLDTVGHGIMDWNDTDNEIEHRNIDSHMLDWNDTENEWEHNMNIVDDACDMKGNKKVDEYDEENDEICKLVIMKNTYNVGSEDKDVVGIAGIAGERKNGYFQKAEIEQTTETNGNIFKEFDNESKYMDLVSNSKENKDACNQFTKYGEEGNAKQYISNMKNHEDMEWETKEEIIIGEDVGSRISVNEYMADDEESDMEPKLREVQNKRETLEDQEYFADDELGYVGYMCRKIYYNEIPKAKPLLSDTQESYQEDLNNDGYEDENFADGEESENYEENQRNVELEQQYVEQQMYGEIMNRSENLSYREKYENNDYNVKCDTTIEDHEYFADDELGYVGYLRRKTYYNAIAKAKRLLSDTQESCRKNLNNDGYEDGNFADGEESENYEEQLMNVQLEQQYGEQQIPGVVRTILTRCRRICGNLPVALPISLTLFHFAIILHYIVYDTV